MLENVTINNALPFEATRVLTYMYFRFHINLLLPSYLYLFYISLHAGKKSKCRIYEECLVIFIFF